MSRELNAFEFFEGTGNSTQVLYRNHLFNKHFIFYLIGIIWRCITWKSLRSHILHDSLFN